MSELSPLQTMNGDETWLGWKYSSTSTFSSGSSEAEFKEMADLAVEASKPGHPSPDMEVDRKPARGLSAYNLFFRLERGRLLSGELARKYDAVDVERIAVLSRQMAHTKRRHRKSHGKISFADLARTIANAWKKLDAPDKVVFDDCAAVENARYRRELESWMERQKRCMFVGAPTSAPVCYPAPVAMWAPIHPATQTEPKDSVNKDITPVLTVSVGFNSLTKVCDKQMSPSALEAVLKQGDELLRCPIPVSDDALKKQMHALELEYRRQAVMLIQSQANSVPEFASCEFFPKPKRASMTGTFAESLEEIQPGDDPFEPRPFLMNNCTGATECAQSSSPTHLFSGQTRDWSAYRSNTSI